mmetsp:Transcript_121252/g.238273  ORF Transcript_121252/g.238273 Transcript_121252/m.238273 type:complete len:110 (+) Transcript_121252:154-483(+)
MNQLKEAEKKATLIVQEARKARGDKMKEAKSEAERIINAYRAEMEVSYQVSLAKTNGTSGVAGTELESSTNNSVKSMKDEFDKKKEGVEKMLLDLVLKVDTTVPKARSE